nr:MAG TPA: Protein of unknown function (DUF2786) [Caudoviricetes sp.]
MNNDKIIVDLAQVQNIVIAHIVNTPKKDIGKGTIIKGGGFAIRSIYYKALYRDSLYLSGIHDELSVPLVSCEFDSPKEAEEAIKKIKKLIAKYNSSEISDKTTFDIAWERAE